MAVEWLELARVEMDSGRVCDIAAQLNLQMPLLSTFNIVDLNHCICLGRCFDDAVLFDDEATLPLLAFMNLYFDLLKPLAREF